MNRELSQRYLLWKYSSLAELDRDKDAMFYDNDLNRTWKANSPE